MTEPTPKNKQDNKLIKNKQDNKLIKNKQDNKLIKNKQKPHTDWMLLSIDII